MTSLNAEIGESKSRGERLGQIDDIARFAATALVNEFYLNRVRLGQRALLSIDGDAYELEISKIYPEVRAAQFEVDLRFASDAPANIRRGQTLQLRLVLGDTRMKPCCCRTVRSSTIRAAPGYLSWTPTALSQRGERSR